MDILKFKKGLEENLPKELEKDTFYISTDTKKIRLNDSVWEDNGYLKELIYKNEKVTSLALNVLNDKINILDEVVNENEKMSSLIANDLNKKFNTLSNVLNENENEITNSIQEINLSVEENHNTINELIEIVKENEDVVSNAIVYLNKAIPMPQDENSTVTVNDKQYVYKGEDEKNIVSNLSVVTDENEAKIYAYNWGSGIQEHILPSATHDLSGVMAASDKKNLDRVNEFINEIENLTFDSLIKVTYDELVKLRNDNELIAGMKYRIIDYVTTTSQPNTQSAGHQFDIIVEALSENILSEDAKAIQNENDGYFDESNVEVWKLKYCLDNDTSRFVWAENVTLVNSKNVNIIDTLITDNEFNEPFLPDYYIYIDTAGNNFNRYVPEEDGMRDSDFFIEYGREISPDGLENQLCIYKNDLSNEDYLEGGAEEGIDYADKFFYWGTEEVDGIIYDKWKKSEVDSGWNITEIDGNVFILTQRITTGEINLIEDNKGKGVIYYMKDEWNNECPYDFKNIKFYREEQDNYVFTFSWINENNEVEDLTLRQDLLSDEGFANGTHNNIIKSYYQENDFKPYLVLNDIVFINTYDYEGGIFYGCNSNTFGDDCYSNTFGNDFRYNTFGNDFRYNTFGDGCTHNTFGKYCNSNTFGDDCYSNTFGDGCTYNTFGKYCNSNTFGDDCTYNTFGKYCNSNTFGNDCNYNTFGNNCDWIAFYDDTEYNYKNGKYTYGGEKLDFISNISLGNGCRYLLFYPNLNLGTIGDDNAIKNITVTKGVNGNFGSNGLLTLEIPVTNNEYELKIARNSNGDIKMYCEADLIQ